MKSTVLALVLCFAASLFAQPSGAKTITLNGAGGYSVDDSGLHKAAADCIAQGGGTIIIPSDMTLTNKLQLGGMKTERKPCGLDLGKGSGVTLTVDIRDGGNGIELFDGAFLRGTYGFEAWGASRYGSRIKAAPTAILDNLIANGERDGNQQGIFIQGIQVQGDPSAKIKAMVSLVNLHSGTAIQDSLIAYFRNIGLEVACDSRATEQKNDTVNFFKNLVIGGIRPSEARPVVLHTLGDATCGLGDIQFDFLDAEGTGEGQAAIEITGSGTQVAMAGATVKGIHFNGGYCEPTVKLNNDCFRITDAGHITIRDFTANAQGGGSGIKISHRLANGIGLISVDNVTSTGGAYSINNTITHDLKPVIQGKVGLIQHYDYDETRSDVGMNSFASQFSVLKALHARIGPLEDTGGKPGNGGNNVPGPNVSLEVAGEAAFQTLNATSGIQSNGKPGMTVTKTVKGSDGRDCTMTFSMGILTATTCP